MKRRRPGSSAKPGVPAVRDGSRGAEDATAIGEALRSVWRRSSRGLDGVSFETWRDLVLEELDKASGVKDRVAYAATIGKNLLAKVRAIRANADVSRPPRDAEDEAIDNIDRARVAPEQKRAAFRERVWPAVRQRCLLALRERFRPDLANENLNEVEPFGWLHWVKHGNVEGFLDAQRVRRGERPRKGKPLSSRSLLIAAAEERLPFAVPHGVAGGLSVDEFTWLSLLAGNWPLVEGDENNLADAAADDVLRAERNAIKAALADHRKRAPSTWETDQRGRARLVEWSVGRGAKRGAVKPRGRTR